MFLKCLILLLFLNIINADYPYHSYVRTRSEHPCPSRSLLHGRVRLRQRMRLAEHSCLGRYNLVGNKYATCRKGEWDVPIPVCIKTGCSKLDEVKNSINITNYKGAWVNFFCLPGFKLKGSSVLYCDGSNWNSSVPACVEADKMKPANSCDFEDEEICGWTQDTLHDFDWTRYNLQTPSAYFLTGPSYDHTYGKNQMGYYMYIEGTSQLQNDTARLLSPVYDSELAKNGCFVFYYHMYGRDIGGLRVYQKPDSVSLDTIRSDDESGQYLLFEKWGEQRDHWYENVSPLKDYSEDFQIVIEGIRGKSYASDLAIDDVAILQGENCSVASREPTVPPPITVESCAGRCYTRPNSTHICGCNIICLVESNCCPDYLALCEYYNENSTDVSDSFTATVELPQTQKLVATKTSPVTTTVAVSTTTPYTTTTSTKAATTKTQTSKITRQQPTKFITKVTTPKLETTKLATTKLATTKLATTKLATTTLASRSVTSTSTRKFTVPIPTTTTRKYTRYTLKPTSKTPYFRTTKISTASITTTRQPTKPTNNVRSTTVPSSTTTNIKTKKEAQKSIPAQSSGGLSGPKVAAITIAVIALFCGLVWVGYAARGSRRFEMLAHLRGRARGESEVRYLNSDVDDDE